MTDKTAAEAGNDKKSATPTSRQQTEIEAEVYRRELAKLQVELVKLQAWVKYKGLKVVTIFEGHHTADKTSFINSMVERLNPRNVRVVALAKPTERERAQWYFQRFVAHLPADGEMVLFDRSWYNRALVERVMGFCSQAQYQEFLRSCPEFERILVRSGIILIKYWLSVSNEEQERRFQARRQSVIGRWKLSPIDLEIRARGLEYSRAVDEMFKHTDTQKSPWYVVRADAEKSARLNLISHLLSMIPYEDLTPEPILLPPRQAIGSHISLPDSARTFVPELYGAKGVSTKEEQ